MPTVQCPIEGCEYATPDVEPVIAAALITTHATSHQTPSGPTQTARVEKVKRPSVSSAGTTEDWQYFKSRWDDYVRRLAIREENTMVARVTLHNMRQDRDEPIRAFGARLRGQASVCKFTQQYTGCEDNVDYTEAMIKDVLCRGLEDTEIQMDLLGNKNQDMTLEQVFRFIEARKQGRGQHPTCYCHRQRTQ